MHEVYFTLNATVCDVSALGLRSVGLGPPGVIISRLWLGETSTASPLGLMAAVFNLNLN